VKSFSLHSGSVQGVIDEEDVRRINRLDLGDHLLNRPDAILLPKVVPMQQNSQSYGHPGMSRHRSGYAYIPDIWLR